MRQKAFQMSSAVKLVVNSSPQGAEAKCATYSVVTTLSLLDFLSGTYTPDINLNRVNTVSTFSASPSFNMVLHFLTSDAVRTCWQPSDAS